jgi:hypothetical protein
MYKEVALSAAVVIDCPGCWEWSDKWRAKAAVAMYVYTFIVAFVLWHSSGSLLKRMYLRVGSVATASACQVLALAKQYL